MPNEWKYQPSQVFDTLRIGDIGNYEIIWLYFNNDNKGNVINNKKCCTFSQSRLDKLYILWHQQLKIVKC